MLITGTCRNSQRVVVLLWQAFRGPEDVNMGCPKGPKFLYSRGLEFKV